MPVCKCRINCWNNTILAWGITRCCFGRLSQGVLSHWTWRNRSKWSVQPICTWHLITWKLVDLSRGPGWCCTPPPPPPAPLCASQACTWARQEEEGGRSWSRTGGQRLWGQGGWQRWQGGGGWAWLPRLQVMLSRALPKANNWVDERGAAIWERRIQGGADHPAKSPASMSTSHWLSKTVSFVNLWLVLFNHCWIYMKNSIFYRYWTTQRLLLHTISAYSTNSAPFLPQYFR